MYKLVKTKAVLPAEDDKYAVVYLGGELTVAGWYRRSTLKQLVCSILNTPTEEWRQTVVRSSEVREVYAQADSRTELVELIKREYPEYAI